MATFTLTVSEEVSVDTGVRPASPVAVRNSLDQVGRHCPAHIWSYG